MTRNPPCFRPPVHVSLDAVCRPVRLGRHFARYVRAGRTRLRGQFSLQGAHWTVVRRRLSACHVHDHTRCPELPSAHPVLAVCFHTLYLPCEDEHHRWCLTGARAEKCRNPSRNNPGRYSRDDDPRGAPQGFALVGTEVSPVLITPRMARRARRGGQMWGWALGRFRSVRYVASERRGARVSYGTSEPRALRGRDHVSRDARADVRHTRANTGFLLVDDGRVQKNLEVCSLSPCFAYNACNVKAKGRDSPTSSSVCAQLGAPRHRAAAQMT
jgi:hypothetical protein